MCQSSPTSGGRGTLRLREAVVAAAELEVEDAPVDVVVHQLEHAGDVVLVDVRDVDEVELLARRARARRAPARRARGRTARMPPSTSIALAVAAGEQQAVALVGLEDGELHVTVLPLAASSAASARQRCRVDRAGARVVAPA